MGGVNGLLVIVGQMLKPLTSKIYRALKIDEKCESIIYVKRLIVFCLISLTWVLFNNGIYASLHIIKNIILCNPVSFFDQNLLSISGSVLATLITIICCLVFYKIQRMRADETGAYITFSKQPMFFQSLVIALLICVCVFTMCATDATADAQFLYFRF